MLKRTLPRGRSRRLLNVSAFKDNARSRWKRSVLLAKSRPSAERRKWRSFASKNEKQRPSVTLRRPSIVGLKRLRVKRRDRPRLTLVSRKMARMTTRKMVRLPSRMQLRRPQANLMRLLKRLVMLMELMTLASRRILKPTNLKRILKKIPEPTLLM